MLGVVALIVAWMVVVFPAVALWAWACDRARSRAGWGECWCGRRTRPGAPDGLCDDCVEDFAVVRASHGQR